MSNTKKKKYTAYSLKDLILDGFMRKVNKNTVNGCWDWTGSKHHFGYGKFSFLNATHGAHRVSWLLFKGDIPPKMFLCHKCDRPCCVNPDHLFLGTPKDNTHDMIRKGRLKYCPRIGRSDELSTNAKLTNKQVKVIRQSILPNPILAKIFNVSSTTIGCIKRRVSFKDVN